MATRGQKTAGQFVHAPMMITLPTAYLAAKYVFMGALGFDVAVASFLTAAVIYGTDRYADDEPWDRWDYGFRLLYVIFNTAILMAAFAGEIDVKI
jgi:hypothetical protein